MSEQCQQPQAHPERCGCAPAGTEQVSSAWLAQLRAEYRQFGDEVERLRVVVAAKDAEIAQLRQHKNDYMEAAEQTARALRNEINDHQEEIRRLDARVSQLAAQPAAVPVAEILVDSRGMIVDAVRNPSDLAPGFHKVYAAPAAPQQGVVMPERRPDDYPSPRTRDAWNDCLDEFARLNADRSEQTDYPECSGNESDCPENEGFGCCGRGRSTQTDAARDVLAERCRQVQAEGWTPEHDDEHASGQMARAAAAYSAQAGGMDGDVLFPWAESWWKPGHPRRMLVKAGALILAEIERLDRLNPSAQGEKP